MRVSLIVLFALMGCLLLLKFPSGGKPDSPANRASVPEPPSIISSNAQTTLHGTPTPRLTPNAPSVPFVPGDRFGPADAGFLTLDSNGDGVLSFEEMTDNLRAERDRWDINKDGQIDLDEWRDYLRAFSERPRRVVPDTVARPPTLGVKEPQTAKATAGVTVPKIKPKSATASRTPNPTFYLPPWLRPCDTDGDGQVALYEWKEKGGSLSDFHELDLNGDGFVTIDELIRTGHLPPGTGDTTVVLPDPVNLNAFRGQINTVHQFEVTGRIGQSIWGTDLYTDDSKLAIAVVHAGVLQVGETGVVKVTIVEGQPGYTGSTRNGVTSSNFGAWNTSYRIEAGRGSRPTSGR